MKILSINAGSSSLKYLLMDLKTRAALARGLCERIGIDGRLVHRIPASGSKRVSDIAMPTHAEAIQAVVLALTDPSYGVCAKTEDILAIGHRVAHGGEKFKYSAVITDDVMAAIEECRALAPLHNGANIAGIEACAAIFGSDIPQVAVFDTAFHQTMPPKAYLYALPYRYYEVDKVRRYGFHGTSHRYVAARAADLMGAPLDKIKLVSCHLGNGSSIAAIDRGKSVDTSMGFTPLAGIPMGTRAGDIDAGIMDYVMERYGMGINEMMDVLNKESGVLGVSGVSFDFRDVEEAAQQGNERARLALEIFAYEVCKRIGGYAAAMGGVDGVVFTAGVGENASSVRLQACRTLGFMGLEVDEAENARVRGEEAVISTPTSRVKALVIPTDEEAMIACDTAALIVND